MGILGQSIVRSVEFMLLPIVRYAIRQGVKLQEFSEITKKLFIQAAIEEISRTDSKINMSKISVASGVHRKDIRRIYKRDEVAELSVPPGERVIGQWIGDRRFCTKSGKPRVLSYKGEDSEFAELLRGVYTDAGPAAVLFDLERMGVIEYTSRGVKLISKAYVPKRNPVEMYQMLGADVQDLLSGVIDNMNSPDGESRNFHAKTVYENIDIKVVPKLQKWLFEQCSNFQMKVDRHLRKFDLDITPKENRKGGGRIAFGSFVSSYPFMPGEIDPDK